ncbi:MAG: M23 family metallopeptidase [Lentimicrobium sp.]
MITWPLYQNEIRKGVVSNTYGIVRRYRDGSPKPHQGWDFKAVVGTQVFAVGSGKVIFIHDRGDYGLQLCHSFEHKGKTYYAFYAHLSEAYVGRGSKIEIDDLIAKTGKSGNASNLAIDEQHLHFEIRTRRICGRGLDGRISPVELYGICPLSDNVNGNQKID